MVQPRGGVRAGGDPPGAGSECSHLERAEPYPIADFTDTSVTQIHRWDAVGQEWLSHSIGQDDATLPELHLLPRVQYLLVTSTAYELMVANPIAGSDPLAALRLANPPDDPLRFEAYWPNEDSPLEDLILLRHDHERLSVEAEVAGGVGEVEVYWLLDGRLNHQGLASDDIELLPGKHDEARLSAVDGLGQAVVVNLPRVVKLLPLELPEMSFAVWTHIEALYNYDNFDDVLSAIRHIAQGGFDIIEFETRHFVIGDWGNDHPHPSRFPWWRDRNQRSADVMKELRQHPFSVYATMFAIPGWLAAGDVSRGGPYSATGATTDDPLLQQSARVAARTYPEIEYWMVSHESNLSGFWQTLDPYRDVERIRASALGIWYENPSAAIVANGAAPGFNVSGFSVSGSIACGQRDGSRWLCVADYEDYLQALYDHGFARWVDIVAYHPGGSLWNVIEKTDRVHAVMTRNGDGDMPLWATSLLIPSSDPGYSGFTPERRASEMVRTLEWMAQDERVTSAHIYVYRDDRIPGDGRTQTNMWGLVEREFINGQPVPTPTWTPVVEFLRSQREQQAAGD